MSAHTGSILGPCDLEDDDMAPTLRSPLCAPEDAPTITRLPSDGAYEDMPETKRR